MENTDLLREMHGDIKVVKAELLELTSHVKIINGLVADLNIKQLHQEGAIDVLRWLFVAVLVPLLGIGVAIAGVALAFVAKG